MEAFPRRTPILGLGWLPLTRNAPFKLAKKNFCFPRDREHQRTVGKRGALEHAQSMAAHESPRTAKL
jgi:hypothetical protein